MEEKGASPRRSPAKSSSFVEYRPTSPHSFKRKWYTTEDDMVQFAKAHANTQFCDMEITDEATASGLNGVLDDLRRVGTTYQTEDGKTHTFTFKTFQSQNGSDVHLLSLGPQTLAIFRQIDPTGKRVPFGANTKSSVQTLLKAVGGVQTAGAGKKAKGRKAKKTPKKNDAAFPPIVELQYVCNASGQKGAMAVVLAAAQAKYGAETLLFAVAGKGKGIDVPRLYRQYEFTHVVLKDTRTKEIGLEPYMFSEYKEGESKEENKAEMTAPRDVMICYLGRLSMFRDIRVKGGARAASWRHVLGL
jgi:hypothetical protein